MIWGIENKEEHFLIPFNEQRDSAPQVYREIPQDLVDTKKRSSSSLNPQLVVNQVQARQIESIYIPIVQNQQPRSRTPTNIRFGHSESQSKGITIPSIQNNPPPYGISQGYGGSIQPQKSDGSKNFVSFKDYLYKEEHKNPYLKYPVQPNNTIQFTRSSSPGSKMNPGSGQPVPISQNKIGRPQGAEQIVKSTVPAVNTQSARGSSNVEIGAAK